MGWRQRAEMEELSHDGRQPDANNTNYRAREMASLSPSRVAFAAFAGALVLYLATLLEASGRAIGTIHHASSIANITAAALVVGENGRDDDALSADSLAAEAAGNGPGERDGGSGDGAQLLWPAKKPNEGRTDCKSG